MALIAITTRMMKRVMKQKRRKKKVRAERKTAARVNAVKVVMMIIRSNDDIAVTSNVLANFCLRVETKKARAAKSREQSAATSDAVSIEYCRQRMNRRLGETLEVIGLRD